MRKLMRRMAKAILRLFDAFWSAVTKPYHSMRDYLRYREAVMMADNAHAKDSDRYYVMPTMNKKLLIMDRKNFRELKRKGYIQKNATMQSAAAECFYYTAKIGDAEPISPELRKQKYAEYKKWCKAMRILDYYMK